MVQLKDPILASIDATAQTFAVGFAGALMAWLGVLAPQVLDKAGADSLSRMTMTLLLPCLEFKTLIEGLKLSDLDLLGEVFLFCFRINHAVHIALGIALGYVLGFVLRSDVNMTHMIACSLGRDYTAFQNTTAVPLMFVSALTGSSITKDDKDFGNKATTYVLFYCVFVTFFKWTVAYRMMERKEVRKQVKDDMSLLTIDEEKPQPSQSRNSCSKRTLAVIWDSVKKSMNPPVYAVIVAIPCCLIPGITKYVISGSGAVFTKNLYAAVVSIGSIASVIITLILGQSLSRGYSKEADITHLELWVTVLARLVLMPAIGMALFIPLYQHGLIVTDTQNRIMAFTMMNIYGCPTSLQLLMISVKHNNQVENVPKLYLFVYMTSVVTMAVFTTIELEVLY